MIRPGDRVTYKAFIHLPVAQQRGYFWDGPAPAPMGYEVVRRIQRNGVWCLEVKTKEGTQAIEHENNFKLLRAKFQRNLPAWW